MTQSLAVESCSVDCFGPLWAFVRFGYPMLKSRYGEEWIRPAGSINLLIRKSHSKRRQAEWQIVNSIWQRKHRWIGHVLRHDGLLHEIIEGRMKGKPTVGEELKCCTIWQMMTIMLHSNGQIGQRGMETQKGCQKPALQQKFTD